MMEPRNLIYESNITADFLEPVRTGIGKPTWHVSLRYFLYRSTRLGDEQQKVESDDL